VGPKRIVVPDETAGLLPIAGGQGLAGKIEHIEFVGAGAIAHSLEVAIGCSDCIAVLRGQQHVGDTPVLSDHAGQVAEALDLAFNRPEVECQPVAYLPLEFAELSLVGEPASSERNAAHKQSSEDGEPSVSSYRSCHSGPSPAPSCLKREGAGETARLQWPALVRHAASICCGQVLTLRSPYRASVAPGTKTQVAT